LKLPTSMSRGWGGEVLFDTILLMAIIWAS
jgi:hypothetical protein